MTLENIIRESIRENVGLYWKFNRARLGLTARLLQFCHIVVNKFINIRVIEILIM